MLNKKQKFIVFFALFSSFYMIFFLVWVFSQAGTLGLYRWAYRKQFLALMILSISPLFVLTVSIILKRLNSFISKLLSILFSIITLLTALALSVFVVFNAYGPNASAPKPKLIDPAIGIKSRIAEDNSELLRIAVSSDPHYGRDLSDALARSAILKQANEEYISNNLDAFVILGDTVEMGMYAKDWEEALSSLYNDAPDLPFLALFGNHDALIAGYRRWKQAFTTANWSKTKHENFLSPSSWHIKVANVHFISLDLLWGPEGFGKKQRAWLTNTLSSIPQEDYIVVLSHCFFYASGYIDPDSKKAWYDHPEMIREVAPIIEGKADLVISGHNHYMEWLEKGGTAWAIVGAMGGLLDPPPVYVSPWSVWFSQGTFGSLILELKQNTLLCEFQDQTGKSLFKKTLKKTL